jgi:hypothetical protein
MEMCLNEVRSLLRNLPVDVLRNTMALLLSDQSVAGKPKSEVTFLFSDACRTHGVETFLLRMDDQDILNALALGADCPADQLSGMHYLSLPLYHSAPLFDETQSGKGKGTRTVLM